MGLFVWIAILSLALLYLKGLQWWVYEERYLPGLLAICLVFPLLIKLTEAHPAMLLRSLPIVGIGMFFHRYGAKVILKIKLLLFSTLTLMISLVYGILFGGYLF